MRPANSNPVIKAPELNLVPPPKRLDIETLAAGGLPQRLLQNRPSLLHAIQWSTNLAWMLASLYLVTVAVVGAWTTAYQLLGVITAMLMLLVYPSTGVFRQYRSTTASALRLTQAWLMVLATLAGIALLTQTTGAYSGLALAIWAGATLIGQILLHQLTQCLCGIWQRRMQVSMRTLLVGSGPSARHLAESINRNPFLSEQVVGVVDDPEQAQDWVGHTIPVLGKLSDLPGLVETMNVDRVYIVMPMERSAEAAALQRDLLERNVDIIWAPDIFAMKLVNPSVRELAGVPLISLSESPQRSGGRAFLKSVMDVSIAAVALIAAAPLMLVIAAIIKLTSRGPVFFRQQRHGWNGRVFKVWKFRSMYLHDEAHGRVKQATRDDTRITPIGRFIRRSSLDELPQLFNVLGGTMSLVGPRPHALAHNLEYGRQINAFMARHRAKPGVTGWAQIKGCRGETDTVEKMQQRVSLDLDYINQWSLKLDLWILVRTPFALFCKNAY